MELMRWRMCECAAIAIVLFCLGGCAGSHLGKPSPDVRAIILENKTKLWKGANIKEASIAAPQRNSDYSVLVCVKLSINGGALRDVVLAVYDNGDPPNIHIDGATAYCSKYAHTPFPELERNTVAPRPRQAT